MRINWEKLVEGDYSPLEEARLFARLLAEKIDVGTIAQNFGRVVRTITDKARIARSRRLSAEVKAMWNLGMINFEEVRRILAQAEKGLPINDQVRMAREMETAREIRHGNERRPRLLRTKTAIVKASHSKTGERKRSRPSDKQPVPSLATATPPPLEVNRSSEDDSNDLVLGIHPTEIMKLMRVATDLRPEEVPWLTPVSECQLRKLEMCLLWLVRHWHRMVREQVSRLLPPPKPPKERVAFLQALREEKPQFTKVSRELLAFVARINAQRTSEATKKRLIDEFARGGFYRTGEDGDADNHQEEKEKGRQKGGRNSGQYRFH